MNYRILFWFNGFIGFRLNLPEPSKTAPLPQRVIRIEKERVFAGNPGGSLNLGDQR
jgi:hypothetical protein